MQSTDCQGSGSLPGSTVARCGVASLHDVWTAVDRGYAGRCQLAPAVLLANSEGHLHILAIRHCWPRLQASYSAKRTALTTVNMHREGMC